MKDYLKRSHFVGLIDGILISVFIMFVGTYCEISIPYFNKMVQLVMIFTLIEYFIFSLLMSRFNNHIEEFILFKYIKGFFCGILLIGTIYFNAAVFTY